MMKNEPSLFQVALRGWQKKCPACGRGPVFIRWISRYDHCTVCGYLYEENAGDLWGFWVFCDRLFVLAALVLGLFISSGFISSPLIQTYFRVIVFSFISVILIVTMPQRLSFCIALEYLMRRIGRTGKAE